MVPKPGFRQTHLRHHVYTSGSSSRCGDLGTRLEPPSDGSSTGWPALESGDARSCYSTVSQVGFWIFLVVTFFTRLTV